MVMFKLSGGKLMGRALHMTHDELYQMVKFYDLLRDMDIIDELPIEVENVFDRLQSMESGMEKG